MNRKDLETAFFERLDQLSQRQRIVIGRSSGQMLQDADNNAILAFYGVLPDAVKPWEENRWFFCAGIHCLWDPEQKEKLSMASALAEYQLGGDGDASESFTRRVSLLLDTPWNDDGFLAAKMLRLIKMMKAHGYMIDAENLLDSLIGWNADSHYVQRKWAKEYAGTVNKTNVEEVVQNAN